MNKVFLISAISVIAFHNAYAMNRQEWADAYPSGTKGLDGQREEKVLHMLQYVIIQTKEARLKGQQGQFKIDNPSYVIEGLLAARAMGDARLRSLPLDTSFVAACSRYKQAPPEYCNVIQRGRKTRISPVGLRKGYRVKMRDASPDGLVGDR